MTPCPNCGANDWKPVTEQRQFVYKLCGNCKYSPSLASAEIHNAKDWVLEITKGHAEAREKYEEASGALQQKETTLTMARERRAKREWEASEKKLLIAEAVSGVVEATESGQITLLIPEVGLFQFEWGNFSLFRAIGK